MRILFVEWIKLKRTPIMWVSILVPILFSACMVWYVSAREATNHIEIFIFHGFFEAWAAIMVPIGAGLLSGLMIHQEEMAGSFNALLAGKTSRTNLFIGKLLMLILLSVISTTLAIVTLMLGLKYMVNIPVSFPIFIGAAVIVQMATIPLLAFHLWVSFAWGMGPSIGIGGGGLLLGALMATRLGDTVWQYIPWGWPVRLSILPGFYMLHRKGGEASSLPFSPEFIANEFMKGMLPAIIFLMAMVVGGVLWFNRWETGKTYN